MVLMFWAVFSVLLLIPIVDTWGWTQLGTTIAVLAELALAVSVVYGIITGRVAGIPRRSLRSRIREWRETDTGGQS